MNKVTVGERGPGPVAEKREDTQTHQEDGREGEMRKDPALEPWGNEPPAVPLDVAATGLLLGSGR